MNRKETTKILYILEDGRLGGMAKMILDIAAGMPREKTEVRVVIGKRDSEALISIANALNVETTTISTRFLSKNISSLVIYTLFFFPDLLKLILEVKRFNPDIVYCNGSQHIKGVIAGKILGKEIVWHMHDTYQPKSIWLLFQFIRKTFSIPYFVASSKRTSKFYNLPAEKTLLSIPPVNTLNFIPVEQKVSYPKVYTVISVANINPDKGIDTLVYTAAKVNQGRSDVRFVLVGLVPDNQNHLFNQVKLLSDQLGVKNLEFLGQRKDIQFLLSQSDIYLCSSNNESGPISVFEAMAMSLPVVSTDVGDLKEIFELNCSGQVYPVKDSSALAAQILFLLSNPKQLKELGAKLRQTAVHHLDITHTITKHIKFYNEIIKTN
jgi:glycosyltransferase involved in cell wall biosynthesis